MKKKETNGKLSRPDIAGWEFPQMVVIVREHPQNALNIQV